MRIAADGEPEILAPMRASSEQLKTIAAPYCDKLRTMQREKAEQLAAKRSFVLNYGDRVRFLGGERVISEGDDGFISYDSEAFYVPRGLDSEGICHAVSEIYRLAAKDYLTRRVGTVAPMLGCNVAAVKVNSAKSHWASCSRRDTLNFSKYCMMADPKAVDYIIIHELCHMYEFNHSPSFWELVERFCPDYKAHKAYLKKLWSDIERENL